MLALLRRNRLVPTFVMLLLAVGFSAAFAQSTSMWDSSAPAATAVGDASQAVTPQQMQTQSKTFLAEMVHSAQKVRRQLAAARESRDVVKVLCLSDKLAQINVATAAARDRSSIMNNVLEQDKDPRNARYEFSILQVLHDRVRTLFQESAQCVGGEAGLLGESKVIVHVDNSLPSTDTTEFPQDTTSVVTQMPPPVSPIR